MYIDIKHRTCTVTTAFTLFSQCLYLKSAYDTQFYICLFERAFKMMKNGVYVIVIALLVAELFKILIYAN